MKQPPCMMSSSEVIEIWKVSMPLGITIFEQVTGFDFFHILAMMASRIPHERLLGRITPAGSRPIPCERLFSQFPPEDSRLIPIKRLSSLFPPEDSRLIPTKRLSTLFSPEDSRLIPTKRVSTLFSPEASRLIPQSDFARNSRPKTPA